MIYMVMKWIDLKEFDLNKHTSIVQEHVFSELIFNIQKVTRIT